MIIFRKFLTFTALISVAVNLGACYTQFKEMSPAECTRKKYTEARESTVEISPVNEDHTEPSVPSGSVTIVKLSAKFFWGRLVPSLGFTAEHLVSWGREGYSYAVTAKCACTDARILVAGDLTSVCFQPDRSIVRIPIDKKDIIITSDSTFICSFPIVIRYGVSAGYCGISIATEKELSTQFRSEYYRQLDDRQKLFLPKSEDVYKR